MKKVLCIALLSGGIALADWRSEQNPKRAKQLAMDYFWKPTQVSGQDLTQVVDKFSKGEFLRVRGDSFFSWQDEAGNTFMHMLVLKSENVALLKAALAKGAELHIVNNDKRTPVQLAQDKPAMQKVFEQYEDNAWGENTYPGNNVWSEKSIAQQKTLFVLVCMLGVAYYGWHTYSKHDELVAV